MTLPGRMARHAPLLAAIATCAALLFATRAELVISREPLNDFALHLPLTERMAEAIRAGENPLDCWVSQWSLGHPVPRTYQPLGPALVALAHVALGGIVEVRTLFLVAHWLLIGLLPLSMFAGARLMGLREGQAAAAAVVSPLVSTDLLFGIELGSACWRGSGLFTQEWAQALLPLALGLGVRCVRGSSRTWPAGVLLALTFAAHFVYGLIGALSLVLAAALPAPDAAGVPPASRRALRLAGLGGLTFALSAWLLVPLMLDRAWINHSRWEAAWKWDSLGLPKVARLLATGDLLDFGRFPMLTLLALAGLVVVLARLVLRCASDAERLVAAGAALWLVLLCGRPAWDGLYDLAGMGDVPLHRLIGGTHLFLILLAAVAVAGIARLPRLVFESVPWRHAPAASALLGALLALLSVAAPIGERLTWLVVNAKWGRESMALLDAERADVDAAVALCGERGGRVWPGSAGGWGKDFGVKWTPFYAFLSWHRVPSVAFLYHAMALTSDIMVRFDEWNEAHWRLFGVTTGVAPPDRELAPFTTEIARFGRFRVFDAPGGGMFDVVDVVQAVRCDRRSFYDVVDAWLFSAGPAQRRHVALDLEGRFPEPGFESRSADERLPPGEAVAPGSVLSEDRRGEVHGALVEIDADHAWVMLKTTWHPAWRATVDGVAAPTSHVTPGFVAVRVGRGVHDVELRYQPDRLKMILLGLAPLLLGLVIAAERLGLRDRAEAALGPRLASLGTRVRASGLAREIAGVGLLALLVGAPLLLEGMGFGHDSVAYPPRVVEVHENLRHGIVLPRWAPDLSAGHGQPFFLYTPPLPGWLAAPVHALTGDAGRAVGLATFAALLAGLFAFRRAALCIASERASWVAAAAFGFAPYVLTDLHVRAAHAESAALLLAPVALLGLLGHARGGGERSLALAALGTSLVGLSHHASALLLVPFLLGLAIVQGFVARSPRVSLEQVGAVGLGILGAACAWMPGLLEAHFVQLDEAREGYFHWSVHAVEPWQLVWSRWGYGRSEAGAAADGMSFMLGPLHLLLAAAAGARAVDAARRAGAGASAGPDARLLRTAFLLAAVIVLGLLMTPLGGIAWRTLPLLPAVQFPWRLSGVVALALGLLAALASDGLAERLPARLGRWLPGALLAALVIFGYPLARPAERTYPDPASLTPDEIARRGLQVTSIEELEPVEVIERAPWSATLATTVSGDATVAVERVTPERWRLVVSATVPSEIVLRLHDFPGWTLTGDGATRLEPEPRTGRFRLRVEPGAWRPELVLRRTPIQLAGILMSLLALIGIAGLCLTRKEGREVFISPHPPGPPA